MISPNRSAEPCGAQISTSPFQRMPTAVQVSVHREIASVAEVYGRWPFLKCIRAWFFTEKASPGNGAPSDSANGR
jgi:hypothetical protein